LTVRPEQIRLVGPADAGALPATITSLVYFGTDTHCHLSLSDGTPMIARLQSPSHGEVDFHTGQAVGLMFAPDAVQVLAD
jgi:spermidine/putrescine transport system ATP-binding protein